MHVRYLALAAAVLTLTACPGVPGAGNDPGAGAANAEATVRRQLSQARELARERGYAETTNEPLMGHLNNGTQEEVGITLNEGRQYLMVGVCDGDCTDMDLTLTGMDGREMAKDVADDDTPVLEFTARATGNHRLRVTMAACSNEPCYYGVALYAKQ